jgi:hypothetical protein
VTDCIVKWHNGSQTIKDGELGDPRVSELLGRLAKAGAKSPSIEFVDDFLSESSDSARGES